MKFCLHSAFRCVTHWALKLLPCFGMVALIAAGGPHAFAASAGRGEITGRVQNAVTGQYLNNARVSVKGTDLITFTDQFGMYQLVNLVCGPVALQVFYTDLDLW